MLFVGDYRGIGYPSSPVFPDKQQEGESFQSFQGVSLGDQPNSLSPGCSQAALSNIGNVIRKLSELLIGLQNFLNETISLLPYGLVVEF